MKTMRPLLAITVTAAALLLFGCDNEPEVTDQGVRGEMGEAGGRRRGPGSAGGDRRPRRVRHRLTA